MGTTKEITITTSSEVINATELFAAEASNCVDIELNLGGPSDMDEDYIDAVIAVLDTSKRVKQIKISNRILTSDNIPASKIDGLIDVIANMVDLRRITLVGRADSQVLSC